VGTVTTTVGETATDVGAPPEAGAAAETVGQAAADAVAPVDEVKLP
jgi:hypothetical protein